jgi:hypothetical protein
MAFKIVKRNKLRVPVKGTIPDDDGKPVKFDFVLLCKRLNQSQIDAVMEDEKAPVADFLHQVTEAWEGVLEESGEPMQFTAPNFDAVLEQPAMRAICFAAYLREVGATAKN